MAAALGVLERLNIEFMGPYRASRTAFYDEIDNPVLVNSVAQVAFGSSSSPPRPAGPDAAIFRPTAPPTSRPPPNMTEPPTAATIAVRSAFQDRLLPRDVRVLSGLPAAVRVPMGTTGHGGRQRGQVAATARDRRGIRGLGGGGTPFNTGGHRKGAARDYGGWKKGEHGAGARGAGG
ncbi:hypothetical protein GWI33_006978 [Rhynchophorus ferrugineus]|uniref:Uncharacterized protein n=1 Tax=Rhynchophorus ferrugineus TaxID=354439 RepID=A0A834MDB4_RHYFE|nr:hypothetical protein GWI33_006978 [Rhynchophorus ferrugineus]